MPPKKVIMSQALELPEADRLELAEALYESLEGPADGDAAIAWEAEIARRITDLDAGNAKTVSWDMARKRIVGNDSGEGIAG
jgi:putative addiction module component (TIGR02574 family)